jgi:hypothetical protein
MLFDIVPYSRDSHIVRNASKSTVTYLTRIIVEWEIWTNLHRIHGVVAGPVDKLAV